ncbi:PIG-L family deacetylase [Haloferax larsenii]|uniref:PIG-L family deacetylase n=1 Tax=Haloferax larsenii TaxID=302484 RepID=A0ABY5RFH0_HALLR|nr:PIG-L deacetylase family protein [Haloferax larsenii]UVE49758.1 PIG-L family deacetylase [Haloferax larsenii]
MSDRTVLVIGAHPDDEVLGAGGTMAKHAAAGDEVHVLIVTEGTTQQYDDDSIIEQKREEARECADTLGIGAVHFGDLPDMRLDDVPHVETNAVIESVVSDHSPDVVYTHSPHEVNLDHKAVYDSTLVATRPATGVERVLAYETPSSTGWTGGATSQFGADVYVDITGYVDTKVEAFNAYESETRQFPHPRSGKSLSARATARGSEAGFAAAEAFSLVYERVSEI